jgi:hypothetical protein
MPSPSSPIQSPPTSNGAIPQETFETLKRKYDQLLLKSGRRRRRDLKKPTAEERARGIQKVVSLYTKLTTLAAVAEAQENDGGEVDADNMVSEEEKRRNKIE